MVTVPQVNHEFIVSMTQPETIERELIRSVSLWHTHVHQSLYRTRACILWKPLLFDKTNIPMSVQLSIDGIYRTWVLASFSDSPANIHTKIHLLGYQLIINCVPYCLTNYKAIEMVCVAIAKHLRL